MLNVYDGLPIVKQGSVLRGSIPALNASIGHPGPVAEWKELCPQGHTAKMGLSGLEWIFKQRLTTALFPGAFYVTPITTHHCSKKMDRRFVLQLQGQRLRVSLVSHPLR